MPYCICNRICEYVDAKRPTAIKSNSYRFLCTCTNEYQDTMYGKGMRLFNEKFAIYRTDDGLCLDYRCTVCGRELDSTKSSQKSEKTAKEY